MHIYPSISKCAGTRGDQKRHQIPVNGITGSYEQSCGCWEPSLCSLQEQQVHLVTEPSL